MIACLSLTLVGNIGCMGEGNAEMQQNLYPRQPASEHRIGASLIRT